MRTVFWENNQVKMIDQRQLPHAFVVNAYDDYRAVADAIKTMVIRGAPAIGAAAAFGMALAALQSRATDRQTLLDDLDGASKILAASRPTAVNLFWALERMWRAATDERLQAADDVRAALVAEAQRLADEDVAINRRMAEHGATLIRDGDTILHHCNTGALAAVDWGTALGVVFMAHEQGKRVHVLVDETRPRLQGAALTCWELMQRSIPMTLIADNAAGYFLQAGKVNLVLVGADRVAANGDTANKIGTYKLAVVAKENGVPFYPTVPTSTVDLSLPSGSEIPIEMRDAREVTHIRGQMIAPAGVAVANPAFDVTPNRYLSGIITEEGIVRAPFERGLKEAVEKARARVRTFMETPE
ncbi:MAG: S-methyl-5-thioribose-1-phosphate isomerase [Chloroflexi bacterium]|nr:S-methyl-5-thioribose-1-phosphate isomerase [Chloroflexota bacterium]